MATERVAPFGNAFDAWGWPVGIYLVHLKHGWFVVGHGFNGMEYSVTIIAALLATALTAPRELPQAAPIREA